MEKSEVAELKPHAIVGLAFIEEYRKWEAFVGTLPNKTFTGVEMGTVSMAEAKKGNVSVIKALAVDATTGKQREYTQADVDEINAIVEARSAAQFPATAEEDAA